MTTDQLAVPISFELMVGCLGLLALLAVVAYAFRYMRALKQVSRYLEAGSFGSIYGAVAGLAILLALTLFAWLKLEGEQGWVIVVFVGGGALAGACIAAGIRYLGCKQSRHDGA